MKHFMLITLVLLFNCSSPTKPEIIIPPLEEVPKPQSLEIVWTLLTVDGEYTMNQVLWTFCSDTLKTKKTYMFGNVAENTLLYNKTGKNSIELVRLTGNTHSTLDYNIIDTIIENETHTDTLKITNWWTVPLAQLSGEKSKYADLVFMKWDSTRMALMHLTITQD